MFIGAEEIQLWYLHPHFYILKRCSEAFHYWRLHEGLWSSICKVYTDTFTVHATRTSEGIVRSIAVWQCKSWPSQGFLFHIVILLWSPTISLRTSKVMGHFNFSRFQTRECISSLSTMAAVFVAPNTYSSAFPLWKRVVINLLSAESRKQILKGNFIFRKIHFSKWCKCVLNQGKDITCYSFSIRWAHNKTN